MARLTQEELAERAGLSERGIQDLERGVRRSQSDTARRLAEALQLGDAERKALLGTFDRAAASRGAPQAMPGARLPRPLPTGTVTFLFSDVEGSTRLWEHHPTAMRAALSRHDVIIAQLVAQHEGVLVRPRGEGDSRFAAFAQPTRAVEAAGAIQVALHREHWGLPQPLRVRLALHTGEADLRDGDYYGTTVNRCARLRAIAHGGQILVSAITASLVREDPSKHTILRHLGTYDLKDLTEPEHVFQLLHPQLPADFPPLMAASARLTNIPVPLTPLIRARPGHWSRTASA